MKNLTITFFIICALIIGYLSGNMFPLRFFREQSGNSSLSEKEKIEIAQQILKIKDKPAAMLNGEEKELIAKEIMSATTVKSSLYEDLKLR